MIADLPIRFTEKHANGKPSVYHRLLPIMKFTNASSQQSMLLSNMPCRKQLDRRSENALSDHKSGTTCSFPRKEVPFIYTIYYTEKPTADNRLLVYRS